MQNQIKKGVQYFLIQIVTSMFYSSDKQSFPPKINQFVRSTTFKKWFLKFVKPE